ncbi:HAD family hydrolase [Rhodococcus tibetensis]|uniref:HAD family hydrolase n=1 Tax=Rhodococcus tibetensis TaxID=2965064 RepID=A0ABT1QK23_9NOCA|nr:HAD family hydrolase [Rhodococcus sp. FXJ9.536]MCQ4122507.1 HAD family hydrolase [Rhodococcus sp. FXJ9.536]
MGASESRSGTTAALFDVDGTLVDSNYLHVDAWQRAFAEVGHDIDAWRVHRAIGLDSQLLLDTLLGDAAAEVGDRAKELHKQYYLDLRPRMRPLAGARDLIRELHRRGVQVVLATSAPEDELSVLREVLDIDSCIAHTTSSGDVEQAKPDPDVVKTALERSSTSPDTAVMVGDAVWDAKAAAEAGVQFIGLLSGGISRGELAEAGAKEVYDDAQTLLDGLESSALASLFGP